MSLQESFSSSRSTEIRGTAMPRSAPECTTIHARAARGIWPKKTAFHWAEAAGVKERLAKYWLAGRPVNEAGKLALIRLLD